MPRPHAHTGRPPPPGQLPAWRPGPLGTNERLCLPGPAGVETGHKGSGAGKEGAVRGAGGRAGPCAQTRRGSEPSPGLRHLLLLHVEGRLRHGGDWGSPMGEAPRADTHLVASRGGGDTPAGNPGRFSATPAPPRQLCGPRPVPLSDLGLPRSPVPALGPGLGGAIGSGKVAGVLAARKGGVAPFMSGGRLDGLQAPLPACMQVGNGSLVYAGSGEGPLSC